MRLLFFIFCVLFSNLIYAFSYTGAGTGRLSSTPSAVCIDFNTLASNPTFSYILVANNPGQCRNNESLTFGIELIGSCPTGTTIQYSSQNGSASCINPPPLCVFPSFINATTGVCEAPTCSFPNTVNPQTGACENNCTAKKDKLVQYFTRVASASECIDYCQTRRISGYCGMNEVGLQGCYLIGKFDGSSCTADNTPSADYELGSPAEKCIKSGKSFGTVNGVVVCTTAGTAGTSTTSTISPPTTTTTTPAATATNPNPTPVTTTGDSTITQTIPAPAGSPSGTPPTVTETTTGADGSKLEETGQKDDFCAKNPNSKLCKEPIKTSCEENPTGPECKHFCEQYPESMACIKKTDYSTEIIGNPNNIPPQELSTNTINFPTKISNVNLTENNTCPAPYSVNIGGKNIPFSYQYLCDYASSFKPIVVTFALLSALYIVYGAISVSAVPVQGRLF